MPDASRPRRRGAAGSLERFVRSAAGGLLLRPWFDEAALRVLTQWYFPLSRGWAAALAAEGSVAAFLDALPCGRFSRQLIPGVLARAQGRAALLRTADERWDEAFFGSGTAMAEAEARRMRAAAALTNVRSSLLPLHMTTPLPPVAWDVEPEASVTKRHGRRLAHPEQAFADDFEVGAVEPSRGFLTHHGVDGWVRFPAGAPCAGKGPAWARVSAPLVAEAPAMPTLIFTHGIGMETEFTGDGRNPLRALVAAGIRVIRPEGPWHGRRRLSGSYGGEPVLARGPGGMLDYLHAHAIEIGRLTAWARATRGGPVAVGGISLGALTTQLVAVAANYWPAEARPDALFLVAPSLSLSAVTFEGSLTRALGVPDAIRAAGWSLSTIDHWRPLMEPVERPAVPAENIVVVIGLTDDVTLAAGGEALVREWKLPEKNVFRSPAGHFSTSLGLARDARPFHRLLAILRG